LLFAYLLACGPQVFVLIRIWSGAPHGETGWHDVLPGSLLLCPAMVLLRWTMAMLAVVVVLVPPLRSARVSMLVTLTTHAAFVGLFYRTGFWDQLLD
jgi:hypothetical protein